MASAPPDDGPSPYPARVGHAEDLDRALLGEPVTLTRLDVVALSGVPLDRAHAVWSALGFPALADDEVAFTAADVRALQTAVAMQASGIIDPDTLLVLARAMGQGLARLAEAQVDIFRTLTDGMTVEQATEATLASAVATLPQLEELVLFVWRRQFAAATARSFASARKDGQPVLAVGFLDLVDFTGSTRRWSTTELERTLERFERDTSLRVAAVGGRVIKTLGDAVLYATDDLANAVEVALATVEAHEVDEDLPAARAGVALGPVLVRLGDVYGQPVNLASRLTDEARPGTVLVDDTAASALATDPAYVVKGLRRRSVRGYRALTPHLLRRAQVCSG